LAHEGGGPRLTSTQREKRERSERSECIADGWYTATAYRSEILQTSDEVPFVEVTLLVEGDVGFTIGWRGGLTKGSTRRTLAALIAMGSTFDPARVQTQADGGEDTIALLDGVGSMPFRMRIVSIACDPKEAPGAWKTFVTDVMPMDESVE